MTLDRRMLLSAGLVTAGVSAAMTASAAAVAGPRVLGAAAAAGDPLRLPDPSHGGDHTSALQGAIDRAAALGLPIVLPTGTFRTTGLVLRPGSRIAGSGPATVLLATRGGPILAASDAAGIAITDLVLDGAHQPPAVAGASGLATFAKCRQIRIDGVEIRNGGAHGLLFTGCSGAVTACRVAFVTDAGIHALDGNGLHIAGNEITDCGNNGIQVWQSRAAEDGTRIDGNRIARIGAAAGGSGQNGNGVNVFRAGAVSVTGNTISDCAYSAIRGNAASDFRVTGNSCLRLGEVAIYAEFGFEGALVASNLVDGAATGIAITNFNEGGRLAVVQGNLIRNLVRREHEAHDKRGEGIAVEADATVTGNTIEGAPTAGIVVGWGKYMRDVVVASNLIRSSRAGILVSADPDVGAVLVTSNMISGARDGAIRAHRLGYPFGPDLAAITTETPRIRISGNMAV